MPKQLFKYVLVLFCGTRAFQRGDHSHSKGLFESGVHDAKTIEAILLSVTLTLSPSCAVFRRCDAIRSIMPVGLPVARREYHGAGSDLLLFFWLCK